MERYINCKLLVCIIPGGAFNKGGIYPLYNINGYSYIALFDRAQREPVLFPLDSFTDGSYKVVGTWDKFEDAEFMEVYV